MNNFRCQPSLFRRGYPSQDFLPVPGRRHCSVPPESGNRENLDTFLVDIFENSESIIFEAELAGLNKEDIQVAIHDKLLTVKVANQERQAHEGSKQVRQERSRPGRMERSFKLPFTASEEQISARYRDGVLQLTITKPIEQIPQKIVIN